MRRTALIAVGLLLMANGGAAASDAEDAVELIMTGDAGWEGSQYQSFSNIIALEDCKTQYDQRLEIPPNLDFNFLFNWNEAIWKSIRFKLSDIDGRQYFLVDCESKCTTVHANDNASERYMTLLEIPNKYIRLPVAVSKDRFENALEVLMSECPGAKG
jgi:hypothetical protein